MPNDEEIIWSSLSDDERREYVRWLGGEVQRVKNGGDPTPCWKGTPQEAVKSLEAELKKRKDELEQKR